MVAAAAVSLLLLGVVSAAPGGRSPQGTGMIALENARRQLQDSECGPSNKDLLTIIEIMQKQQTYLEAQNDMVGCLNECRFNPQLTNTDGDFVCQCDVVAKTLAPAPENLGATLYLAYQLPEEEVAQLPAWMHESLEDDCWISPEEIALHPYATLLRDEYAHFVATQIAAAGIGAADVDIHGFSSDGDNIPGCNADVVTHAVTIGIGTGLQQELGNSQAFYDCWLTMEEISGDPEAAAFADAFIQATADTLNVNANQVTLNGICAGCVDANDAENNGGGCAGEPWAG